MIRKSITTDLKVGAVAFLLFVLLFAVGNWKTSPGFIVIEFTSIFRDPGTQWMVFLCLGVYFTTFFSLRARIAAGFWRATNSNLWLAGALLISACLYAIDCSPSLDALTLLGGAVLGQGVAVWAGFNANKPFPLSAFRFPFLLVSLLVILLALASVGNVDSNHIFKYHGHARWSGPWDNPNIFGLLMGSGVALAVGSAVSSFQSSVFSQSKAKGWKLRGRKFFCVLLCLFVAILMGRGLLHSYSRGAWLATACGVTYLFWSTVRSPQSMVSGRSCGSSVSWLKNNYLSLSAILLSVVILSFWHSRQTEWRPAHRAFSAGNQNDFSWRNRLSAWEGALQITAEHPWFGAGWNQSEPMYEHYYLPPQLTKSAAIEMNDYLMLGATLGIPALFCFGMYLWLSLTRNTECRVRNSEGGNQKPESRIHEPALSPSILHFPSSILLAATCRAGAIVLLVGFWFDGGLFKLATASTFWILLELGSIRNHEIHQKHEND